MSELSSDSDESYDPPSKRSSLPESRPHQSELNSPMPTMATFDTTHQATLPPPPITATSIAINGAAPAARSTKPSYDTTTISLPIIQQSIFSFAPATLNCIDDDILLPVPVPEDQFFNFDDLVWTQLATQS